MPLEIIRNEITHHRLGLPAECLKRWNNKNLAMVGSYLYYLIIYNYLIS